MSPSSCSISTPRRTTLRWQRGTRRVASSLNGGSYNDQRDHEVENEGTLVPKSVLHVPNPRIRGGHPTQKPLELFEYLIRTYTEPGEVVLDNVIGSGTTAVAALRSDRHFIGMESSEEYLSTARERINALTTASNS